MYLLILLELYVMCMCIMGQRPTTVVCIVLLFVYYVMRTLMFTYDVFV